MSKTLALGIVCVAAATAWWLLSSTSVAPLSHAAANEQPTASTTTVNEKAAPTVSDAAADEPAAITREEVLGAPAVPAGPPLQLRVLDASTGLDVTDVLVVAMTAERRDPSFVHLYGPVVVEHGVSPLSFPPVGVRRCSYAVRTPKHAWDGFSARAGDTEVHEVRLQPGGDVEVAFAGATPPGGSELRVRRVNSRPTDPLEDYADIPAKGTVLFQGLTAQLLVFTVEKGEHWCGPVVVGRAEHTVVAGMCTHVTIPLDHVAEPPRVRVAGRLTISPSWSAKRMCFEPRGTARPWHPASTDLEVATMLRVSDTEYVWDAGMLTVGWYRVGFWDFDYWTKIEVGPADDTGHHIVVPDPCEVVLRVIDSATEQLVSAEPGSLRWLPLPPDGVEGLSHAQKAERMSDGTFALRVPPVSIRVVFWEQGYQPLEQTLEVQPGRNELTLRARREFGIDVVLQHGGADVPWANGFRARLLDEADQPLRGDFGRRIRPEKSGRLWLVLEELGDYVAEPVLVDVPEVGWVRVVVPVRRR